MLGATPAVKALAYKCIIHPFSIVAKYGTVLLIKRHFSVGEGSMMSSLLHGYGMWEQVGSSHTHVTFA